MSLQQRKIPSWDDLRLVLEVQRSGSLSAAARTLGMDPSTASRKLASLETTFRVRLLERTSAGAVPTPVSERVAELCELAESHINEIAQLLAGADALPAGTVRIAVAEGIDSEVIIPSLASFWERHPNISLEIVAGPQIANLARREADLALRFVRPDPSSPLVARRVAQLASGVFVKPGLGAERFVDWDVGVASAEEQRFSERHFPADRVMLRVNRVGAKIAAVEAGLGAAVLPESLAEHRGLARLPWPEEPPPCDLWLVGHRELLPVPRVRAAWEFLAEITSSVLKR